MVQQVRSDCEKNHVLEDFPLVYEQSIRDLKTMEKILHKEGYQKTKKRELRGLLH